MSATPKNNGPVSPWQGAFAAYSQTFEQLKANPAPALLFIAVYVLLAGISIAMGEDATSRTTMRRAGYESVAALVFLLALPTYGLALADRKVISVKEFMRFDIGKYLSLFAVSILTALVVAASFLLFIVPAVWTIAWFAAATYVIADTGAGPVTGMKTSKLLSRDHKGKVWGLIGVAFLVSLAAGMLSLIPLVGTAAAAFVSVLNTGTFAALYRWFQANATA